MIVKYGNKGLKNISMKTALVTGASRGIGRAISEELAQNGYQVVGVSRHIEPGEPFVYTIQGDVSDIGSHVSILNKTIEKCGSIDLLVNNAGVAPIKRMDILDTTVESYDRIMDINLRGPFFLSQVVARSMIEKKDLNENYNPRIIFITSVSAVASSPERAEYCVSKAGLSMTAQAFADRLVSFNIPVYEIRPGVIMTDMTSGVKEKYDKQIEEGLIPQGRWGKPEDIARGVVALALGSFPYSTGTIIELSGGMNIRHL